MVERSLRRDGETVSRLSPPPQITSGVFPELTNWLNWLREYTMACEAKSTPTVRMDRTPGGSFPHALSKSGSSSTTIFPFEVCSSAALKVKVATGYIVWHDKLIQVVDGTDSTLAGPEITLAASVTTHIWLSLDDEFSSGTPTGTLNSGTAGWSGYPAQPNPPARRHWPLASVVTDTTSITSLGLTWKGHISWTPDDYWL